MNEYIIDGTIILNLGGIESTQTIIKLCKIDNNKDYNIINNFIENISK